MFRVLNFVVMVAVFLWSFLDMATDGKGGSVASRALWTLAGRMRFGGPVGVGMPNFAPHQFPATSVCFRSQPGWSDGPARSTVQSTRVHPSVSHFSCLLFTRTWVPRLGDVGAAWR